MKLFLAPHNDDETLFGAFTLLREKPLVCIVYDSQVQRKRGLPITVDERRDESERACTILGCSVGFLGVPDDALLTPDTIALGVGVRYPKVSELWAPAFEPGGHDQHNVVALAAARLGVKTTYYTTYTREHGRTKGREVPIENAKWIALKLTALACYRSQHTLDPRAGCWPWFIGDQREYYKS